MKTSEYLEANFRIRLQALLADFDAEISVNEVLRDGNWVAIGVTVRAEPKYQPSGDVESESLRFDLPMTIRHQTLMDY